MKLHTSSNQAVGSAFSEGITDYVFNNTSAQVRERPFTFRVQEQMNVKVTLCNDVVRVIRNYNNDFLFAVKKIWLEDTTDTTKIELYEL